MTVYSTGSCLTVPRIFFSSASASFDVILPSLSRSAAVFCASVSFSTPSSALFRRMTSMMSVLPSPFRSPAVTAAGAGVSCTSSSDGARLSRYPNIIDAGKFSTCSAFMTAYSVLPSTESTLIPFSARRAASPLISPCRSIFTRNLLSGWIRASDSSRSLRS